MIGGSWLRLDTCHMIGGGGCDIAVIVIGHMSHDWR